jgi:hypothetical protein
VLALVLSLAASIAGNLAFPFLGSLPVDFLPVLSAIVAVYPALALAVSVELVLSAIRPDRAPTTSTETVTESLTLTEVTARPDIGTADVSPDDPMATLRLALEENPGASSEELAPAIGRSASWVRSKRSEILAA